MTTHPESHDLVEALRVLCTPEAEVFSDSERFYRFIVASRALLAALAAEPASQVPANGWRPIVDADREIATIQTFGEIVLRNSHPAWVRDEDGRTYEAVWTVDARERKREYWWDIEAESPASPVEIYPHPLAAAPDQEGPADGKWLPVIAVDIDDRSTPDINAVADVRNAK